ncbi:MAG: hypothetical protein ACKVOQ_09935 [Cyclobacteriaceae bacterium]
MISVKIFFIVGVSWVNLTVCFSQTVNGFYFAIEDRRNCASIIYSLDEKERFCITKEPIIRDTEFESVSNIEYDQAGRSKFIKLRLTKRGFALINMLSGQLYNKKLFLVVGNHLVAIVKEAGQIVNCTVLISGPIDSKQIDWVHDKLKKR